MTDPHVCAGRVCAVTGAGTGLGRSHALMLAAAGARVVVNDIGAALDGSGRDAGAAQRVVDEIVAAGGDAVANVEDITTWDGAESLLIQALGEYGRLDVLVNNAGILRDRMVFSMTEDEWDAVVRVHLKGTFVTTRHATAHWRELSKQGIENDARIVNTTSVSGLFGKAGQSNYGAAKAGIAAFTQIVAEEVASYGVTVNAVSPNALTRMNEEIVSEETARKIDPAWVSVVVTWLASPLSRGVTGQVIEASGLGLAVAQGWTRGPKTPELHRDADELDVVVRDLIDRTPRRTSIKDPM